MEPTELERKWTGEDVADSALAAELARQIAAIAHRKGVEVVLDVGRLLLDRCHAGDPDRVGPSATIDALAAIEGVRMSRTGLYRAVQTWLQYQDLPAGSRESLALSVQYELLTLPPGHVERGRIARVAAAAGLGVKEVRHEVRRVLDLPAPEPARPTSRRQPPPSLQQATRLLSPWNDRLASGRPPTKREAEGLARDLAALKELLARVETWASGRG